MRRTIAVAVLCLSLAFSLAWVPVRAAAALGESPPPEVLNTCSSPQTLNPLQFAGGSQVVWRTVLSWDGTDYGVAYIDNGTLYFDRVYADGSPAWSTPLSLGAADQNSIPAVAWDSKDQAWAVVGQVKVGAYEQINVYWVYAAGWWWGPQRVSWLCAGQSSNSLQPAVAWNGTWFVFVWADDKNYGTAGYDIYSLEMSGPGGGGYCEADLTPGLAGDQAQPTVVTVPGSPGGGTFEIAWEDHRVATNWQIYGLQLRPGFAPSSAVKISSNPPLSNAGVPALAATPTNLGVVWDDNRSGTDEVYFNRLTVAGAVLGADAVLTSSPPAADLPRIAWNGTEYEVVYQDNQASLSDVYITRVSEPGVVLGSSRLTTSGFDFAPDIASSSQKGFLVSCVGATGGGPNFLAAVGCSAPSLPPPCPSGVAATNVASSNLTLSWLPSADPSFDIAYYQILQNGAPVGKTAGTSTWITNLAGGLTYTFGVVPTNAAQLTNGTCTNLLSVTTPLVPGLCPSPQAAPWARPAGGVVVNQASPVVWNGSTFAIAYKDESQSKLIFQTFYADGTPAAPAVPVATGLEAYSTYGPGLLWNGSGYAVAWWTSSFLYFQRLDAGGAPIGSPTTLNTTSTNGYRGGEYFTVQLATSGSGYAVAWLDYRNSGTTGYDIYATLLNPDGTIAGPSNTYHDIAVCTAAGLQTVPSVAWFGAIGKYVVAWDDQDATPWQLSYSLLDPVTGTASAPALLAFGGSVPWPRTQMRRLSLADASPGSGLGVLWEEIPAGGFDYAIWFTRFNSQMQDSGPDVRLTATSYGSYEPFLTWNGQDFGAFFDNWSSGASNIWFQHLDGSGEPQGPNVEVTNTPEAVRPMAAWGLGGFLATSTPWNSGSGGANMLNRLGCALDSAAPTCPGNLLAFSITGTSCTVAWGPASDPASGVAEYVLYRDNALLARTTGTSYNDTGLSLSTTYNYMVQPVNAAGVQNTTCTTSIYVKTNPTLLMIGKSDPNALLSWSDIGLNSYNVFRGTDPRTLSLIGTTSGLSIQDPNVLLDQNLYFYSVDDPGQ